MTAEIPPTSLETGVVARRDGGAVGEEPRVSVGTGCVQYGGVSRLRTADPNRAVWAGRGIGRSAAGGPCPRVAGELRGGVREGEELHGGRAAHQSRAQVAAQQQRGAVPGDCAAREERDLMLQLKKVVDMQRDQIRALTHETTQRNKDAEALQEQLDRFMKMNEDLRHKMSVLQAQLKSSLQRKTELEALLQEKRKESDALSKTIVVAPGIPDSNMNTSLCATVKEDSRSSQPCFTKEEVKQILQERHELKTNLFLVNEELQYYQRELLNDERIPSLLLCGIKSAIKKQRKKIKAKMLGITESATSSSDEEDNTWAQAAGTDCVDSKPADSKIKSLFGTWYSKPVADTGPWEIITPKEINQEQKGETSSEND
uniref:Rab interacting lysosomal protein n=1 Tax=Xenopus tropicalis TaxID=8364 RepID=A0A6I8RUC6_XENTR